MYLKFEVKIIYSMDENFAKITFCFSQAAIRKFCAALRRDHNPSTINSYVQIVPAQVVRLCNLQQLVTDRFVMFCCIVSSCVTKLRLGKVW